MKSAYRLLLLFAVSSIFVIGLIMIFDTTSAEVLDHALEKSTHQALFKQLIYACLGIILSKVVCMAGYQRFLKWSPYLLFFFTFLLLIVLIPGIGREVNGSRRWISLAGFSFQPSEFFKYVMPAYFAYRFLNEEGQSFAWQSFMKLIGLLAIPIILVLIEPNNGTAGVLGITLVMMCVLTRIRFRYWALPLSALLLVGGFSAYHLPYVSGRLKVYLHPELDLRGRGHQPYQAKIAAGSGQLWGRGPGNSLQKLSYLPEAQNDYIAAIFAEEYGFMGMSALILIYMIVGYIGFCIAYQASDLGGFYLASIITFLICFQAFMNLGVVSGLLPSTGLNLPFFSQGGSSLMANLMGIGLLVDIAQHSMEEEYV